MLSDVIPGPSAARSPESITTVIEEQSWVPVLQFLWLWISGSPLRGAPE